MKIDPYGAPSGYFGTRDKEEILSASEREIKVSSK